MTRRGRPAGRKGRSYRLEQTAAHRILDDCCSLFLCYKRRILVRLDLDFWQTLSPNHGASERSDHLLNPCGRSNNVYRFSKPRHVFSNQLLAPELCQLPSCNTNLATVQTVPLEAGRARPSNLPESRLQNHYWADLKLVIRPQSSFHFMPQLSRTVWDIQWVLMDRFQKGFGVPRPKQKG